MIKLSSLRPYLIHPIGMIMVALFTIIFMFIKYDLGNNKILFCVLITGVSVIMSLYPIFFTRASRNGTLKKAAYWMGIIVGLFMTSIVVDFLSTYRDGWPFVLALFQGSLIVMMWAWFVFVYDTVKHTSRWGRFTVIRFMKFGVSVFEFAGANEGRSLLYISYDSHNGFNFSILWIWSIGLSLNPGLPILYIVFEPLEERMWNKLRFNLF